MEKLEVPTAVVCTKPFVSSGKAMAVAHGLPDYPFAIMPHPINATSYEVLDQWAEDILPEVFQLLTADTQTPANQ